MKIELKGCEACLLNGKIRQLWNLENLGKKSETEKKYRNSNEGFLGDHKPPQKRSMCYICNENDNNVLSQDGEGKAHIDYIACKTFVDMKPRQQDKVLYKKRLCSKCLSPGVKWDADHSCNKTYSCNQHYANKRGQDSISEKHVLVCGYHADQKRNKHLLEVYKKHMFEGNKFQDFSKAVNISCFFESYNNDGSPENIEFSSIYAFQTIKIDRLNLNLFYDSGCGDIIVSKKCIDKLMKMGLAKLEYSGQITLNGVGNQQTICQHMGYMGNKQK